MNAYIFMCSWETYGECIARNLFGHAKNFVAGIQPGDLCYLYQYDSKTLYGVWKATSDCRWHEKGAWDGKFKYQVRVSLTTDKEIFLPLADVQNIIEHSGMLIYKLDTTRSEKLLEAFKTRVN